MDSDSDYQELDFEEPEDFHTSAPIDTPSKQTNQNQIAAATNQDVSNEIDVINSEISSESRDKTKDHVDVNVNVNETETETESLDDDDDEIHHDALEEIENEPPAEDVDWEVDKVLDKRTNPDTGNVEYLLAWKNWTGPATWEPEENCNCTILIKRFEKDRQDKLQIRAIEIGDKHQIIDDDDDDEEEEETTDKETIDNEISDNEIFKRRKLKLDKIIGICSNLSLIVKWEGKENLEKIPINILRKHYPQEILDFLLSHVRYI